MQKVTFVQNATESLTQYSQDRLNEVVEMMLQLPSLRIELVAYGDHSGNIEYNKRVSERRANTVKKCLLNAGIEKSRISIRYFQEVPANSKQPEVKSRAVEFLVIN